MTSRIKATMVENRFENMSSGNPQPVTGISRRELLKRGGKVAAAAAVSSVFSPFVFTGKAAATKTLSFWQFYAPARQAGTQSKWFEDCVKGWNATHDVKVELQFVPVQDYIRGSKLQTAFAGGQGPDIFIISPGDFLRYYNGGVLVDLTSYMEDAAKKDLFPNVMEPGSLMKRSMESRSTSYPWRCFTASRHSRRLDFRRAISRKPGISSSKSRTS